MQLLCQSILPSRKTQENLEDVLLNVRMCEILWSRKRLENEIVKNVSYVYGRERGENALKFYDRFSKPTKRELRFYLKQIRIDGLDLEGGQYKK